MELDPEAGELWEGYFDLERLEACLGIRNGFGTGIGQEPWSVRWCMVFTWTGSRRLEQMG